MAVDPRDIAIEGIAGPPLTLATSGFLSPAEVIVVPPPAATAGRSGGGALVGRRARPSMGALRPVRPQQPVAGLRPLKGR